MSEYPFMYRKIEEFLEEVAGAGFELVHEEGFKNRCSDDERFFIFFSRDGVLLCFDSHRGDLNSGNLYYNWQPTCFKSGVSSEFISSGHWANPTDLAWDEAEQKSKVVWAGSEDCRRGWKQSLKWFRQNGSFLNPWVEDPHCLLIHHGDTKDCVDKKGNRDINAEIKNIEQATLDRIYNLPEELALCLAPTHAYIIEKMNK